jgi:hypothetical protein
MKTVGKWLSDNSKALGGAAALVTILSALLLATFYIRENAGSDITVRFNIIESTIPPDINELLFQLRLMRGPLKHIEDADLDSIVNRLSDHFKQQLNQEHKGSSSDVSVETKQNRSELYLVLSLLNAIKDTKNAIHMDVVSKLFEQSYQLDKLILTITNNTTEAVPKIRVRLSAVFEMWGTVIAGTFLSPSEVESLQKAAMSGHLDYTMLLPEIRDLPPNSSIEFQLFGHFSPFIEPQLTASGLSHEIRRIIEIEEAWLIFMMTNPSVLIMIIYASLLILALGFSLSRPFIEKRVRTKVSGSVFYNAACGEALAGRLDEAMILLRQAISHGYSNRKHISQDEDLELLRGRQDYKELLAEMRRENQ